MKNKWNEYLGMGIIGLYIGTSILYQMSKETIGTANEIFLDMNFFGLFDFYDMLNIFQWWGLTLAIIFGAGYIMLLGNLSNEDKASRNKGVKHVD